MNQWYMMATIRIVDTPIDRNTLLYTTNLLQCACMQCEGSSIINIEQHSELPIDKYKTWSFHLEETSSEILQLVVTLGVSDCSYMSVHEPGKAGW